jgi:hypothetical protein
VQPTFDATTATHIVTETNENHTLRALGVKRLSEIPLEIPTVKWSWVISGKPIAGERDRQQMDYEFMHAAFPSRMDAGRALTGRDRGRGKQKLDIPATADIQGRDETPCVVSPSYRSMYLMYKKAHKQSRPTLHRVNRHAREAKRIREIYKRTHPL